MIYGYVPAPLGLHFLKDKGPGLTSFTDMNSGFLANIVLCHCKWWDPLLEN